MSNRTCEVDLKRINKNTTSGISILSEENNQNELEKTKMELNSIKNQIRLVKLRQNEADTKLGFSLRGGKEATGSSVGVFVSNVEKCSEADRKGLKIGDQLLQVNGLNVNQATYEEVIGLIKQTPKCHDILLKVNNFGKIPFQEKSGDCIKWLQVMDLIDSSAGEQIEAELKTPPPPLQQVRDRCIADYKITLDEHGDTMVETALINEQIKLLASNDAHNINSSAAFICKQQQQQAKAATTTTTTSSLSSDEGIESCESRRAISLSSESENELPQNHNQATTNVDTYQEDSAVSSTLTLSNDESCSCSSASCSISISSVQTTTTTSGELENEQQQLQTTAADLQQNYSILPEDIEVIVKVPGGKQTNESFGCGVVKGPDEWPGIFVQNVKPGSLAQRVGLQPGDQLTRADGQVLVELTFDTAIGLIKQLQQQQDELLLHVKKGAALKHLSENRQRNQVNQQQQQQFTGTEMKLTTKNTSNIKQHQQQPLNISCGNGKGKEAVKASKIVAQDESDQENWSFDESPSNQMQAPSCESNDRKAFTAGNNEISGTKNQLSGKHWLDSLQQQQQQWQQVAVRSKDEQERSNSNLSRIRIRSSIGSGNNNSEEVGEEETDFLKEETKQTAIRIDNGLNKHTTPNQCSSSRLDKSYTIQANQANRKSNGLGIGDSTESSLTNSKFLVGEEQTKSVVNEMKTKQQRQQVANLCKSHNYNSNGNHTDNDGDKKVKRGYSLDDGDSRKINCCYKGNNNETIQDCENNHFKNDGGDYCDDNAEGDNNDVDDGDQNDEEEDEEIRIVSQNCKLHHQPFHNNFSKSNLVQEKLFKNNNNNSRLSENSRETAKSRDILTRKFQLNQANKKRQTVDDMRRQLDIKGSSRRPSMHRYVSFENLSSSRLACSLQQQQQQQQKHLLRGSPVTRRANAEENRYINDDYIVQSRLQLEQRSLSTQRLYSRSSSVLGQSACCTQARPSLVDFNSQAGSKTVRCIQKQQQQKQERQLGMFPMVRQHSQCCLQQAQQQQQQQQQQLQQHHHYGSALDPQFALSRSKARSMDKLNMSMNLSYLNISQNPYKVSRQALLDKVYVGSVTSSGNSGKSKRERRMLMKNQLLGHSTTTATTTTTLGGGTENGSLQCCKPMQPLTCLPNSATPIPFYNYPTASRLISTVSGASSTAMQQNRMRLLQQAACCTNLYQTDSCSVNLCQSQLCSSHYNKLIKNNQTRIGCYSPNLDLPIYTKCSGKLKNGFVADLNTKIQKLTNNNNNSSYSCCSSSSTSATLTCCPTNSIRSSDLSTVCCSIRQPSLDCLKYEENSKGATTDSSGYISSSERYHAPRLLKMCPVLASPPQPPPPPPPPPKIISSSSSGKQQHYNCQAISQQRDTRQRLTTFLSTGCPPASMNNSGSNGNNNVNRHLPNSSDVSPTCSSSYSSPSTSITSTQSDHSSLSVDRLRSVSPLNYQQTNKISSTTTSGSKPIGSNQKISASYSNGKSSCNPCSTRSIIPCPPPMPAPDKEFERKLNNILRQQDILDGGQQQAKTTRACGDESGNNKNLLHARKQQKETNENHRLCFVDELKLIAKQQQQQQQQSASQVSCSSSLSSIPVSLSSGESSANNSSPSSSSSSSSSSSNQPIDSSTLIKIINASKSKPSSAATRAKGGFSCQVTTNNGLASRNVRQHSEQQNNKCNHKCSATSTEKENDHQLRCINNNNIKSSHRKHESTKSVKLDDEHNKRRQHELLMKEFKSAHSRMFKRRNANLEEESNQQVHSTTPDSNKPLENNNNKQQVQQQKAQMRTLGANKSTVGLLQPQQPVHLAAAN